MRFGYSVLVSALSVSLASADLLRTDFSVFFSAYNLGFQKILNDDALCGDLYRAYRIQQEDSENSDDDDPADQGGNAAGDSEENDPLYLSSAEIDPISDVFNLDSLPQQLVECMLRHTPEIIKVRMASAQVLLGLMPSLLAVLGPCSWHTGMVAFIGKRPLLAFLLAAGAPTLSPAMQSGSELKDFLLRRGSERINVPVWFGQSIFLTAERGGSGYRGRLLSFAGWLVLHLLALGSIGNVAELSYRIGSRTVFAFSLGNGWLMILWAFLGLSIHAIGASAVFLRIKDMPPAVEPPGFENPTKDHETTVSRICIQVLDSTIISALLTWFTGVYTVVHVFFGTLLFSSILFVSVADAVFIMLRLFGSVVFCRFAVQVVVAIDRMRVDVVSVEDDKDLTERQKTW